MTNIKEIELLVDISENEFKTIIYPSRKPALLRNLKLGHCVEKWSAEYLSGQLGSKEVKVHVTTEPRMDFITKNFLYKSLPFDQLIQRASVVKHQEYFLDPTELYYLRSLGDNPRKDIADIRKEFPSIAKDIEFPNLFDPNQFFSSVFRVASAGTCLWSHYDVMDNILIQVVGRKRAVLFHPDDALFLYMNGDKSEVTNIDEPDLNKFPDFVKATQYCCIMEPGDVLFIPALWFHNMTAIDFGVAVNVFWKHLQEDLYDKKDPYGNKDLVPAARANLWLEKGLKALEELPYEYKRFYARKMIARINKLI